jgi:hypothetical protein
MWANVAYKTSYFMYKKTKNWCIDWLLSVEQHKLATFLDTGAVVCVT